MSGQDQPQLRWIDEDHFEIDGVRFRSSVTDYSWDGIVEEFLILKDRSMIERQLRMARDRTVRTILDIGIWHGGSAALYDLVLQPQKLVAIEYGDRALVLDKYIAERGRAENLKTYYGVN